MWVLLKKNMLSRVFLTVGGYLVGKCMRFFLGCLVALGADVAVSENASEIMRYVDDRYTGDTQTMESTLMLIDKRDRKRIRSLKLYGIENEAVEKSILFFMSPSDVKGTSYLSFDWKDSKKPDDSWLFLPALQKTTRVATTDRSGAFMGSDFTYTDISGLDYDEFEYAPDVTTESVDDVDCWVISGKPKDASIVEKTGYTSIKVWVRKDNYVVVKAKYEVNKGNKVKYYKASDLSEIDGIWTSRTMQMITTRSGKKIHTSILKLNKVNYNVRVEESMLGVGGMQRGI